MSVQTQSYIDEMTKMYLKIIGKEKISLEEAMFLEIYKKTIFNQTNV